MIDKLRGWASRFKWAICLFSIVPGGMIGSFLRYGAAWSVQQYLEYVLWLIIAWVAVLGIGWLLSQWIEFKD
ncbi:MAG TPA: hypothetical protein VGD69_28320 [Herpetosiphonaceae bacterium]